MRTLINNSLCLILLLTLTQCNEDYTGKKTEHYPDGTLWKEMHYKSGKLHGRMREYTEKGSLSYVCYYEDGIKTGRDSSMGIGGPEENYIVRKFKNGVYNGHFVNYYKNGAVMSDEVYKNGKVIFQKSYYPNGNIMDYNENEMIRQYNMNGSIMAIFDNRNHKHPKRIIFDKKGRIIKLKGEVDYLNSEDSTRLDVWNPGWKNKIKRKLLEQN